MWKYVAVLVLLLGFTTLMVKSGEEKIVRAGEVDGSAEGAPQEPAERAEHEQEDEERQQRRQRHGHDGAHFVRGT